MWIVFDWLFGLAGLFWNLWNRLPEKAKREIIEAIIKAMEELLRAFYRNTRAKEEN